MQLRFTVAYDGTAYRGWQVQPDGPTVQETLERAFGVVLREPVRVMGAGRTDAGVHATGQVAVVRCSRAPDDLTRIVRGVNALTPDDVAIRDLAVADDAFDPRRHARSRRYVYRIWNAPEPAPLWRRVVWHVPRRLDATAMAAAARSLEGEHDFAAFRAADAAPVGSTVRRVFASRLGGAAPMLEYEIEATAFLKHMVRTIVGTLVEIGLGVRTRDSLTALVAQPDRRQVGATAPARGLVLVAVRY